MQDTTVTNTATVSVNLGIELYDDDGELLYQFKGPRPHDLSYTVIAHLLPGSYYVVIDDQGRNDTDAANYYICVNSATVDEMTANDTMATAATATEGAEGFNFDGSLEYLQDQDWYRLEVPAAFGTATQNLIIQFARDMETLPEELSQLVDAGSYQITVQDSQGNLLHDYSHAVSLSSVYSVADRCRFRGPLYYRPACHQRTDGDRPCRTSYVSRWWKSTMPQKTAMR